MAILKPDEIAAKALELQDAHASREESVSTIATDIASKDSPFMQQADVQGRTAAARRGLMNSTMAGAASRAASLDYVLPMAQQEAGQNFQRNLSAQDAIQRGGLMQFDSDLQRQRAEDEARLQRGLMSHEAFLQRERDRLLHQQDRTMAEEAYGYQRGLAEQGYGHQRGLAEQGYGHQLGLLTRTHELDEVAARNEFQRQMRFEGFQQSFNREQAALDRMLQTALQEGRITFEEAQNAYERDLRERLQSGLLSHQAEQSLYERRMQYRLAEMDAQMRVGLAEMDRDLQVWQTRQLNSREAANRALQERLEQQKITSTEKNLASTMLNNAFNDFEDARRSILSNPDLPADERNRLLAQASEMLQTRVDFTNSLYDASFEWPDNPFISAGYSSTTDAFGGGSTSGGTGTRSSSYPYGTNQNPSPYESGSAEYWAEIFGAPVPAR